MSIIVLKSVTAKHTKMYVFNKTLQILIRSAKPKNFKNVYFEVKWNSETPSVPHINNSIRLWNSMHVKYVTYSALIIWTFVLKVYADKS